MRNPSGSQGIHWRAQAVGAFIGGLGLITTGSGTMPGVLLHVIRLCSLLVVFNTRFAVGFQVSMIGGAFVMQGTVRMGASSTPFVLPHVPGLEVPLPPFVLPPQGGIKDILDMQCEESE